VNPSSNTTLNAWEYANPLVNTKTCIAERVGQVERVAVARPGGIYQETRSVSEESERAAPKRIFL